jgi:predicted CXXCH cytochrome family protein
MKASKGQRILKRPVMLVVGSVLGMANVLALMGAATTTSPRDPVQIKQVLEGTAHRGDCDRCHTSHGTDVVYSLALIGPNDNTLCDGCHTQAFDGGSYPGTIAYNGSSHGTSNAMIWPGPVPPPRIEAGAQNKCVNCHDPHGWTDGQGTIPNLLLQREEDLCLNCHDGQPASGNVQVDIQKPFRHPVTDYSDRHEGALEALPENFGTIPLNKRHSECEDCHNPHLARSDGSFPVSAPDMPAASLGVSRVLVQNGPAGTAPAYTFIPGSDSLTTPLAEYQLCFKCHSSWTTQPSGQTDLARALNPANASYHPVEAAGRNQGISFDAFTTGWSASSLVSCDDCHGSDLTTTRGPHGSIHRYLLRNAYTASSASRSMEPDELCFSCHKYAVYADSLSPDLDRAASRFNKPGSSMGHAEHVGAGVPCYACHVTHGAATEPHLIATGRVPGLMSYTETPDGGSCMSTCHDTRSYTVTYAR